MAYPTLVLLSETVRHADLVERLTIDAAATGNLAYDAHVAALAIEHGFDEILTEDRDFHRFPGIRVVLSTPDSAPVTRESFPRGDGVTKESESPTRS